MKSTHRLTSLVRLAFTSCISLLLSLRLCASARGLVCLAFTSCISLLLPLRLCASARGLVCLAFTSCISPLWGVTIDRDPTGIPAAVELRLREGLTGPDIPLPEAAGDTQEAEGVKSRWEVTDLSHDLRLCTLTLTNASDTERKLEPSLRWVFGSEAPFVTYWDGSAEERPLSELKEPLLQSNIKRLAPWSAVYGEKEALLVGIHPAELRSYLRSEFQPSAGAGREMATATRLVLAPGQSDTVRFLFGGFPIRFGGQREVVQRLHDAFPEVYLTAPDINPAIHGVAAQYWASRKPEETIPGRALGEFLRRMHATWDWCYAPFKRTGDHWGHEKFWDYTPHSPFKDHPATIISQRFSFDDMPREKFLELRKQFFNRDEDFHGRMFHIPAGVWVEEQLADAEYADAEIRDPNFKWRLDHWVTGWDREVKVLPWFTSYEKVLREDFARIAREYNIGGIGLDVARGGPKYRGPAAQKPLTIRAYDEEGIYIDQGVGVAKFIDYLHTLKLRNDPSKRLAIIGNPEVSGQTFTVTARYDAGMFEGPPYHPKAPNIPLARYILGRKPLTWWAGWGFERYAMPNWAQYTQEDFIRTMKGLIDYVIFASYTYGAYPTLVMEFGAPKLMDAIPRMEETFPRGWQAVFPVDYEFDGEELYTARYGKGLTSRLFFGNPYDEPRPISLRIANASIGEAPHAWAALHGGEPVTASLTGSETKISTALPSRVPALFDAVAELPQGFTGETTTQWRESLTERELILRVKPTKGQPAKGTLRFPQYAGFRAPGISVGGKAAEASASEGTFAIPLPEDDEEIRVRWVAEWAGSRLEALAKWPFLDADGNPTFEIVADNAGLRRRLEEYFRFCGEVILGKEGVQPVKFVAPGQEDSDRPRLILQQTSEQPQGISVPSDKEVVITFRDLAGANAMLDAFFRLLDQRYPYHPGFIPTWGINQPALKHFDMLGKTIEP